MKLQINMAKRLAAAALALVLLLALAGCGQSASAELAAENVDTLRHL